MIAWLIIRKKRSFGYQSCRFRSGNNGRRRRRIGGREDSCPSPGRILHRAHRKMPSAPGKTPMPSTRLSTLQWAFEAMSIWSAIILVKMGKSVYGYKGCAQPHPRDQLLFGRPPVRLIYEMENYSANRHKDIYFIDMLPFGKAGEMRLLLSYWRGVFLCFARCFPLLAASVSTTAISTLSLSGLHLVNK